MATKDELNNFDDLDNFDSDTLLNDEGIGNLADDDFGNLDDFDDLNMDSDLDLNLEDITGGETQDTNEVTEDANSSEQDSSDFDQAPEAASDDGLDIGSDGLDGDTLDSDNELSDDDLDLSLEANFDEDNAASGEEEVSSDITDEDLANFDESQYSDLSDGEEVDFDLDQLQSNSDIVDEAEPDTDLGDSTLTYHGGSDFDDDDDDDDYGVDLKVGPVTIEFTQIIEPQEQSDEPAADELPEQFDESFDEGVMEEITDDATAEPDEVPQELDEEDNGAPAEEDSYDINNDEDLEFEVAQDKTLSDIDMDNVFESNKEEGVLNISLHDQDDLAINNDENDFLSGEPDERLLNIAAGQSAEQDIQEDSESDITLPEGNELDHAENVADSLISDDDLNALELDEAPQGETESAEEETPATEAELAEDIVIEEENDDDNTIALDGDEDLGIDLENAETVAEEAQTIDYDKINDNTTMGIVSSDSSLDEDLSSDATVEDIPDEEFAEADENVITDELPPIDETQSADEAVNAEDGNVMDIDLDDIPTPAQSDSEDDDEVIGLSGQELDDILTTTELVEAPVEEMLTEEEREQLTAVPEDPSFDNDDSIMSDDELAASVTIPGEPVVADNDILHNGDLDNYNDVPLPGEEDVEMTETADSEQSDLSGDDDIVIPATDDIPDSVAADESETIDLASFDADLAPIDDDEVIGVSEDDMNAISEELEDTKIDISEEEQNDICNNIQSEMAQQSDDNDTELKQDIKGVLSYLDQLLDCLPEEKIKEFAESKQFETYRKLFEQLDIKH